MLAMKRLPVKIGDKFNQLTVIGLADKNAGGRYQAKCECVCGNIKMVAEHALRTGRTKSCGCSKDGHPKHNMAGTRLYNTWARMKDRCLNPANKDWLRYGGRGISICDEWQDFIPFKDWALSSGYSDGLTIDRTDNDGNYSPRNCRWVTMREQNQNRHLIRAINGRYAKEW